MKNRSAIEAIIDRIVKIEIFDEQPTLNHKIALLSLVLEELKHERQIDDDLFDFETYTQSEIAANKENLFIVAPVFEKHLGKGIAPIQLQSLLLMFLLLQHRSRLQAAEIIQDFITKIRLQLTYLDFKKTKSGWARCFANTRSAGRVLREYGLLKYNWQDGYKTWELTLAGYLVAVDIFHRRSSQPVQWSIPPHFKEFNFDVLPEIRNACDDLKTYDDFIARLASICGPDAPVFKTFEPALQQAFSRMKFYWAGLKNPRLSQKDRRTDSLDRMRELERETITDEFYEEFSKCIQINEPPAKIPAIVAAPLQKAESPQGQGNSGQEQPAASNPAEAGEGGSQPATVAVG